MYRVGNVIHAGQPMKRLIDNPRQLYLWVAIMGSLALVIAYALEYYYRLPVCALCQYSRYLMMTITVTALVGWCLNAYLPLQFIGVIVLLLGLQGSLGIYQVLIEQKMVMPPESCRTTPFKAQSVDELRQHLRATKKVPCDQVHWSWGGISLAGYQAVFSFAMMIGCGVVYRRLNTRK